jgi:hypothetical protein
MFSKYAITLAALFLVGGTAVAAAYEEPENKIGDRYPVLEKIDRTVTAPAVSAWRMKVQRNAKLNQFTDEDPENKIADRYPFLEQSSPSVATASATVRAPVQRNAKLEQFVHEEPENKIADRYPFLEQSVQVASGNARVNAMRIAKPSTSARKASLGRQGTQSVY